MDPSKFIDYASGEINSNPDAYALTSESCNLLKCLPLQYGEFALGLINEYYSRTLKKSKVQLEDFVSNASKKNNTLNLPYKGRTYENGKVPQYDAEKLPQPLQKILSVYLKYILNI